MAAARRVRLFTLFGVAERLTKWCLIIAIDVEVRGCFWSAGICLAAASHGGMVWLFWLWFCVLCVTVGCL